MRVVIADDALLIREGARRLLDEAGHVVVAAVPDVVVATARGAAERARAAVVDIRMPPSFTVEGLDAARRIARMRPGTGVLVLSQYLESGYAVELLTGAPSHVGYLLKDHLAEGTVLVDALTRVAAGECLVDPAVVERLVTHPRAGGPLAPLSARETEVLSMVARGWPTRRSPIAWTSHAAPWSRTSGRSSSSSASPNRPTATAESWPC